MRFRHQSGSGGRRLWVYLERGAGVGRTPAVGLSTPGAVSIHFLRDDTAGSTRLRLASDAEEDPGAAVLAEVAGDRLPGIYRLDLPAHLFAAGSRSLFVSLRGADGGADGADAIEPLLLEFELVAYDPYDGVGIGLDGFTKAVRHQNLTSILVDIMPDSVRALAREGSGRGTRERRER